MVDCLRKNGRNGMEVVPLFLLAIICFIIEQLKKMSKKTTFNPPKIFILGCDTTSKVGTKYSALRAAGKIVYSLLNHFGKYDLAQEMIYQAEMFLIECISKDSLLDSFD